MLPALARRTALPLIRSVSVLGGSRGPGKAFEVVKRSPQRRLLHLGSPLAAKDYYKVLQVPRNASAKDIKKAYYQLAKKYHPDVNKDDPQAARLFQEVSEAYEVLSDEGKRRDYDSFGGTGAGGGGGFPGGGGGFPGGGGAGDDGQFRQWGGQQGGRGFRTQWSYQV